MNDIVRAVEGECAVDCDVAGGVERSGRAAIAELERAGVDGGVAGVGIGSCQGECAGAGFDQTAARTLERR